MTFGEATCLQAYIFLENHLSSLARSIILFIQTKVPMTLKQATVKQWVNQAERQLPSLPQSLRVINQQLWCCCNDGGIVVFDSELQQQRTILAGDMGDVRDVADMSNGDAVIATGRGLYHGRNGKYSRTRTICARHGLR